MVWTIAVFAAAMLIAILVVTLRAREGDGLSEAMATIQSLEEELALVKERLENLETIVTNEPPSSIQIDDEATEQTSHSARTAKRSRSQ